MFEIEGMNTKKNKIKNNKTIKKEKLNLWEKRLKYVADRDLALVPLKIDLKYNIGGSYSILQIKDGNIKIYYSLSNVLREHLQPRYKNARLLLENLQTKGLLNPSENFKNLFLKPIHLLYILTNLFYNSFYFDLYQ